jgi:hypothetical protein
MIQAPGRGPGGDARSSPPDALAYEAPFLIEKLLKERIVETADDGHDLFFEVKKFIVLTQSDNSKAWEMYSLRVDEVWHQFILFTKQYTEFCTQYFGRYVHHSPGNAPESAARADSEPMSFETFQSLYSDYFGETLPHAWYDENSVTLHRRVYNDRAGILTVRERGGTIDLVAPEGHVLLSVNDIAWTSLAFIASHGVFYVRELPGELTDEEKIALIATLVEFKILRVAP